MASSIEYLATMMEPQAEHEHEGEDIHSIQAKQTYLQLSRMLGVSCVVAIAVACMICPAFASGDGITNVINTIGQKATNLFNGLRVIASVVLGIYLVWTGFEVITGGQRGADKFFPALKVSIIFAILVWGGPLLVTTFKDWFNTDNSLNTWQNLP